MAIDVEAGGVRLLIFTGGDCLLSPDVFDLVDYAAGLGIPVAMSPSVTPMLTSEAIAAMVERGVKAVSLSLDGATAATHDGIRGTRATSRTPGRPSGHWSTLA